MAADLGARSGDDLADRRGEDVDAADDQHVVGAADAADPRAGAAAGARARPHADVVAGAEAQQRRGAVAEVREHELALGAVLERRRRRRSRGRSARRGRSRARRGACRPAASHSPQSETPMSPMPIASVTRAPQPCLELRAEGRLAAAGLAGDEHALDARRAQVDAALGRPLDAGGRRTTASARRPRAAAARSRCSSRSVFPVPTGMWQRPMRSKAASAAPAANGPGVVGRDDPLRRRRRPRRRSCAPSRSTQFSRSPAVSGM